MRHVLVALVAVALTGCGGGKPAVPVSAVPTGSATACLRFSRALPRSLGPGLSRRRTAPSDVHVAAYGDPPVVVRCGAPATTAYEQGDQLYTVDGLGWFAEDRGAFVVWSLPRAFVNVEVAMPKAVTGDHLARLTPAVRAAQSG